MKETNNNGFYTTALSNPMCCISMRAHKTAQLDCDNAENVKIRTDKISS